MRKDVRVALNRLAEGHRRKSELGLLEFDGDPFSWGVNSAISRFFGEVESSYPKGTLGYFASELGLSPDRLIEQFDRAGIKDLTVEHEVTEGAKVALLNYLKNSHRVRDDLGIQNKVEGIGNGGVTQIFEQNKATAEQRIFLEDVNDELLFLLAKNPSLIYELGSRKFEELVAKLFEKRGYQVELTPATRDGGYDIFARLSDNFASFVVFAECKRYKPENKVGVELVRGLYGVTEMHRANKGLIITSSFFTKDAQAEKIKMGDRIELKDYNNLTEWLLSYASHNS